MNDNVEARNPFVEEGLEENQIGSISKFNDAVEDPPFQRRTDQIVLTHSNFMSKNSSKPKQETISSKKLQSSWERRNQKLSLHHVLVRSGSWYFKFALHFRKLRRFGGLNKSSGFCPDLLSHAYNHLGAYGGDWQKVLCQLVQSLLQQGKTYF